GKLVFPPSLGSFVDPGEVPHRRGVLMLSPFRIAGMLTAIFAACGPAWAQEMAPADSGVSIQKMSIDSANVHTVKYYVKGGSPRLQALVRRIEWTENELSVVEQMQGLKLDTVVNERRATQFRTAALTNPYFPPGFFPPGVGYGHGGYWGHGASPLQRALSGQLAYEATPQAALQLIGYLEQQQTQLEAELKALPPKEKKAAEGPIEALRPRLAALTGGNDKPAKPQSAAPTSRLPANPPAFPRAVANGPIEVQSGGT